MPVETQYRVALEMGFSKAIVKRILHKCVFESAGDLVDYLEENVEVLEAQEESDKEDEKEERQERMETPAVASSIAALANLSLRDETEKLYKQSVCLVCFKRNRSFVTLPCSHFTVCDSCEAKTRKCPRTDCRQAIECTIRTYF